MRLVRQLAPLLMAFPVAAQPGPSGLPPATGPQIQLPVVNPRGDEQPNLGPNVVIKPRPNEPMIEEYRVNDRIFMIKVTPEKGFSYYLVDTDGDGRLDSRRNALEPNFLVPQWTLMRWK
jgi:hypothetical protein